MTHSTYTLVSLPHDASVLVGPKAENLARLRRMGLPVPSAGLITTMAYREHLAMPVPAAALSRVLAGPDPQALAELRHSVVEQPLSLELADRLRELHASLGGGTMAVRSSATAEDLPDRSFAGQHGTYFRSDLEGCLLAVKHCWASLWNDSAFAYREHLGLAHDDVAMAVILQPLVAAESAGVAFTVDPLTGATDRVVVESCFGLGEALVSGKVSPDRFVFSLPGFKLLERTISRKDVEVLAGFDGHVYEWPTPLDRARSASVGDATAKELARHAVAAADGFGHPVDVEWALQDGRIYLLQARPVTTLPINYVKAPDTPHVELSRSPEPSQTAAPWVDVTPFARHDRSRTVWSNMNTGEVLPGVVTPATYSVIVKVGDIMVHKLFARLGVHFGEEPLFGRFAGRVYFNVSAITVGFAAFPAFSRPDVNKLLGGMQERPDFRYLKQELRESEAGLAGTLRFIAGLPGFLSWAFAHRSTKAPVFARRLRAETAALLPPDPNNATEDDLARSLRALAASLDGLTDVLAFAGMAMANYTNLQSICRRWFADEGPTLANRLVTGLGDLDSARTAMDLWKLARLAGSEPTLKAALLEAPPGSNPRTIAADLVETGAAFLQGWDAFLDEHGHHARGEIELYTTRWREDPGYLLTLLTNYLRTEDAPDPTAREEANARRRLTLTADLRKRLWDPVRRGVFDYVLRQAQMGSAARENLKSEAVRRIAAMRTVMLPVGRRLTDRGVLIEADDVFFFGLDEIEEMLQAESPVDAGDGTEVGGTMRAPLESVPIGERRAEFERDRSIEPPAVFMGRLPTDWGADVAQDAPPTGAVLRGLPVSSGVVEGSARVIPTVASVDRVLPGEVLVVPFTDPGWAPFLLPAAGVVMNMGGLLSHGSIIAREYGIPAVVNVGPATAMIRTGQRVRVDGDRGVVTILD